MISESSWRAGPRLHEHSVAMRPLQFLALSYDAGTTHMDTSSIHKGQNVLIDEQPYVVIALQSMKSGAQSLIRVKLRNLITGGLLERTYKAGEKLVPADVDERQCRYISPDGSDFVFMDLATGEEIRVQGKYLADSLRSLNPGYHARVSLFKGQPLSVERTDAH